MSPCTKINSPAGLCMWSTKLPSLGVRFFLDWHNFRVLVGEIGFWLALKDWDCSPVFTYITCNSIFKSQSKVYVDLQNAEFMLVDAAYSPLAIFLQMQLVDEHTKTIPFLCTNAWYRHNWSCIHYHHHSWQVMIRLGVGVCSVQEWLAKSCLKSADVFNCGDCSRALEIDHRQTIFKWKQH